jgi:hypothetical protein
MNPRAPHDFVHGSGNLLGNLLCAVANVLNGGAPLGAIAGLQDNQPLADDAGSSP